MSDYERIRLVILGGAGVGKSCIVKRFLNNTYSDKYRSTVEDLYNREYDLGQVTLKAKFPITIVCLLSAAFQMFTYCFCGQIVTDKINELTTTMYDNEWYNLSLKEQKSLVTMMSRSQKNVYIGALGFNFSLDNFVAVDILDTAGDLQFPAMRRLSIATAHAFILVYATTSAPSFAQIKQCFEEVREQRADYQEVPIVVAGNKLDLASTHREVRIEDVSEWVFCELPKLRAKVLECSAKDDYNIKEIFRNLLTLSRILPKGGEESCSGLKRRSSAYVSATSKGKGRVASGSPASQSADKATDRATNLLNTPSADTSDGARSKPRSRSLIRRSSRKAKQQIRDAPNPDDCNVQ